MIRPLRRPLAVLTVAGALLGGAPPAAAAEPAPTGNGAWAVGPATSSRTYTPRLFFSLEGRPGTAIRDTVRIWNLTAKRISFDVYGADGYNTPRDGAFALRTGAETQSGVGAWIKVARSTLSVPARGTLDVPFVLTVPANATPGEHIGGLVALNRKIEGVQDTGAARVGIQRAVAARVYLKVAGQLTPGVRVDGLAVDRGSAPGATIRYRVTNTGNVRLSPAARVRVTGAFGRVLRDFPSRSLPELLPGQHLDLSLPWASPPPLDKVTVTVETSTATGLISRTRTGYVVVPWLTVLIGAAAMALLWFGVPPLIRSWRLRAGIVRR
ncbi:hypothetical protein [Actinocorallia longicatena]|uniref:DUF916 domain-containing protein n=1 Tax=Actinocorallia longicatena TaxID=111803 RepID=A0ABP6Q4Y3_9ACTN